MDGCSEMDKYDRLNDAGMEMEMDMLLRRHSFHFIFFTMDGMIQSEIDDCAAVNQDTDWHRGWMNWTMVDGKSRCFVKGCG